MVVGMGFKSTDWLDREAKMNVSWERARDHGIYPGKQKKVDKFSIAGPNSSTT